MPLSPAMLQGCRPKCSGSCQLMNTLAVISTFLLFTSDKQVDASDIWPAPYNQVQTTAIVSSV